MKINKFLITIINILIFIIVLTINVNAETKFIESEADLQTIFVGVSEENIFKLNENINFNNTEIQFKSGEYKIDLNGFKINLMNSYFNINGANLIITDSSVENKGTIESEKEIIKISSGEVIIEKGNFISTKQHETLDDKYPSSDSINLTGGKITIKDGNFNSGLNILGTKSEDAIIDIQGGKFCAPNEYTYGIYAYAGMVSIRGGEFTSWFNLSLDSEYGNLNAEISGGNFKSDKSLMSVRGGNINITGGTFKSNSAECIYISDTYNKYGTNNKVIISGGNFEGVTCAYIKESENENNIEIIIKDNANFKAIAYAIDMYGGRLTIDGGEFQSNNYETVYVYTEDRIDVDKSEHLTINGGNFISNNYPVLNTLGNKTQKFPITITGGNFTTPNYTLYINEGIDLKISGGRFESVQRSAIQVDYTCDNLPKLNFTGGTFIGSNSYGAIRLITTIDSEGKLDKISELNWKTILEEGYELTDNTIHEVKNQTLFGIISNPKVSVQKIQYPITIGKMENGKITLEKETAGIGDEVTLIVEPDEGYELEKLIIPEEINIINNSFIMPAKPIEISAKFKKATYEITIKEMENGRILIDNNLAKMGDKVTLIVEPDEGYELEKIILPEEVILVEDNTFIMPAGSIDISAIFKKVENNKEDDIYEEINKQEDNKKEENNNENSDILNRNEDKINSEKDKNEILLNPKTSDNILIYVKICVISIIILIINTTIRKSSLKNKK